VYFDEVKESKISTLQLYGAPEITSVSIPKVEKSYGGNKLPATIKGKNFRVPNISESSFSGIGAGITKFKIVAIRWQQQRSLVRYWLEIHLL